MLIFNFNQYTGIFIGESEADKSPLEENVFLIPAGAIAVRPPIAPSNKIAVINATKDGWDLVDDYVGTDYWLPTGEHHVISDTGVTVPVEALPKQPVAGENKAYIINATKDGWALVDDYIGKEYWLADTSYHQIQELGMIVPSDAILVKPPKYEKNKLAIPNISKDGWDIKDDYRGVGYWLVDGSYHTITDVGITVPAEALFNEPYSLVKAKAVSSDHIKAACSVAIVSGITCAVLGSDHSYPTSSNDQLNLNGLVTESLLPNSGDIYKFWCADLGGIWERRIHTKLQIQTLGLVVSNHVKNEQEKYEQKLSEIALADEVSLASIVW